MYMKGGYMNECWKYAPVMLLTPTWKVRERAANVAGKAWLARPWTSENVGVRQRAGDIEAHIVVGGFPHYSSKWRKGVRSREKQL